MSHQLNGKVTYNKPSVGDEKYPAGTVANYSWNPGYIISTPQEERTRTCERVPEDGQENLLPSFTFIVILRKGPNF